MTQLFTGIEHAQDEWHSKTFNHHHHDHQYSLFFLFELQRMTWIKQYR